MLRRLVPLLLLVPVLGLVAGLAQEGPPGPPPPLLLEGDPSRGAQIADEVCSACHGDNGNSMVATFPRLSGQQHGFLAFQLFVFREGLRPSPIMNPIASQLSDQDIADLAAFFSSQEPSGPPWPGLDTALVEQGATLFNAGNVESGLIACAICHGQVGQGVTETGVPRIGGQGPDYVRAVLQEFGAVPDFGHPAPNAMHIVVSAMTEQELQAVVAYIASLPWGEPTAQ